VRPFFLAVWTETILNLPDHAAPKLARSKLESRLGLTSCAFVATENLLNRRRSRGLRSGAGRRGWRHARAGNVGESVTLGQRGASTQPSLTSPDCPVGSGRGQVFTVPIIQGSAAVHEHRRVLVAEVVNADVPQTGLSAEPERLRH
jgi:hypothetical protein